MGRAFEFRKARKFKRWGNMARVFTKLGKEITIAAKAGGPDPENNPHLRALMRTPRKRTCRRRMWNVLSSVRLKKISLVIRK